MELLFNVYALTIASLQALLPREKCWAKIDSKHLNDQCHEDDLIHKKNALIGHATQRSIRSLFVHRVSIDLCIFMF